MLIPITEKETAWLLYELAKTGDPLDLAFGSGGAAIQWDEDENKGMPKSIELLGLKRGILNENCDGAGI